MGKSCGTLAVCSCIAQMLALALASVDCLCDCTCVCTCICMGWIQVCRCLHDCFHCVCTCVVFVFTPALHLRYTGMAIPLALHWCCTWVAPVLECLVSSAFWKETLRNLHLLWHLLAVVCMGICCWLPSLAVPLALQLEYD